MENMNPWLDTEFNFSNLPEKSAVGAALAAKARRIMFIAAKAAPTAVSDRLSWTIYLCIIF